MGSAPILSLAEPRLAPVRLVDVKKQCGSGASRKARLIRMRPLPTDLWTDDERERFKEYYTTCGKDFFLIAKKVRCLARVAAMSHALSYHLFFLFVCYCFCHCCLCFSLCVCLGDLVFVWPSSPFFSSSLSLPSFLSFLIFLFLAPFSLPRTLPFLLPTYCHTCLAPAGHQECQGLRVVLLCLEKGQSGATGVNRSHFTYSNTLLLQTTEGEEARRARQCVSSPVHHVAWGGTDGENYVFCSALIAWDVGVCRACAALRHAAVPHSLSRRTRCWYTVPRIISRQLKSRRRVRHDIPDVCTHSEGWAGVVGWYCREKEIRCLKNIILLPRKTFYQAGPASIVRKFQVCSSCEALQANESNVKNHITSGSSGRCCRRRKQGRDVFGRGYNCSSLAQRQGKLSP
jgi:hypothetical protein